MTLTQAMDASKSAMSHEEECPSLTPTEGNPVTVAATSIKLPPLWSADPPHLVCPSWGPVRYMQDLCTKNYVQVCGQLLDTRVCLLQFGIICPSSSSWLSPLYMVPKRLLAIDNHMVLPTKSSYLTGTQSHIYRTSPFPCMVLVKSITELH